MDEKHFLARLREEKHLAHEKLLSRVVHDLNNHLSGVIGYAHLILAETLSEQTRLDAEKILKEAERCSCILQDLGRFYRKPLMELESVFMKAFLSEAVLAMSDAYKEQATEISFSAGARDGRAEIDKKRFREVLEILVKNGMESANRKGVPARVRISMENKDNSIIIQVCDNGAGIPGDLLSKICDPFFTTQEYTKEKGCGLPVAFNLLRHMNGTLDFPSASDDGAVARIELPLFA